MAFLYFSGLNLEGELQDYTIGGSDMESGLELLSAMVKEGCQLRSVKLDIGVGSHTVLPIDAFDGQPIKESLQLLQRQWEEILFEA